MGCRERERERGQEQKRHVELRGGLTGRGVGLKEDEGNAMFGSKA